MVTETIHFNEFTNRLNNTRKDLMLLYSEYLLRHSFISQSRLDVTRFVICLNFYSKHGKQGVLWCPPSPGTHGEPVAVCSVDLLILPSELQSLFHLSVFLNLNSNLIFITDVSQSMELHSTQNILF